MPDLSPQPPQPQTDAFAGPNGDRPDPLATLHHMSRTAGLGAQDYVAINTLAVVALLLGVASALSLVASLLLVIPVAGVICGAVALYQIRDSNGTQTGRPIAWAGILLSLLFASLVGFREVTAYWGARSDRQAVAAAVDEFGKKLMAADFQGAYGMIGPRMQERLPFADFEGQMKARYAHPSHGKITSFTASPRVRVDVDAESGVRAAETRATIQVEAGPAPPSAIVLARQEGPWRIESWDWFPPRPPQPTPARSAP